MPNSLESMVACDGNSHIELHVRLASRVACRVSRVAMQDSGKLHIRDESSFGLCHRGTVQRLLAIKPSFSRRDVVDKGKGKLCAGLGKAKVRQCVCSY
jgi:hypothetical protein